MGDLNPSQIRVELYAESVHGNEPDVEAMVASPSTKDSSGVIVYSAQVPATRPVSDYTARIVPRHPNAAVPLETGQILWQR